MTKRLTSLTLCAIVLCISAEGLAAPKPSRLVEYKPVERKGEPYRLKLHIFNPGAHEATQQRPCIVLFHSGGWNNGEPSRYFNSCHTWAKRGMVAISAEYRVRDIHGGTPFDSVSDGKSAIRWVRTHAKALGVNPDMIAAGGSSAGGQVAAATGHLTAFDEAEEDPSVSSKPNALMLTSPVMDNGPNGYGHSRVRERWREFSPLHNIRAGAPPTILFMGDSEARYLSVEAGQRYENEMKAAGSRCERYVYAGHEHGGWEPEHRRSIEAHRLRFMASLGYIASDETTP